MQVTSASMLGEHPACEKLTLSLSSDQYMRASPMLTVMAPCWGLQGVHSSPMAYSVVASRPGHTSRPVSPGKQYHRIKWLVEHALFQFPKPEQECHGFQYQNHCCRTYDDDLWLGVSYQSKGASTNGKGGGRPVEMQEGVKGVGVWGKDVVSRD